MNITDIIYIAVLLIYIIIIFIIYINVENMFKVLLNHVIKLDDNIKNNKENNNINATNIDNEFKNLNERISNISRTINDGCNDINLLDIKVANRIYKVLNENKAKKSYTKTKTTDKSSNTINSKNKPKTAKQ